jgi:hypothetical protein
MEKIYLKSEPENVLLNAREALIYGFGPEDQHRFKETYKDPECTIIQETPKARSFAELKIIAETYEGRSLTDEELMEHIHYIHKNIKKLSMWYCADAQKVVVFDKNRWSGAHGIDVVRITHDRAGSCGYIDGELYKLYRTVAAKEKESSSILV